jgi:hypothetical protein
MRTTLRIPSVGSVRNAVLFVSRAVRGAVIISAFSLAGASHLSAQSASNSRPEPIKDNSFLIEEAYNQEAGVVQHISTFNRLTTGGTWAYTFGQEWPVRSMRHQLSFSVPFMNAGAGTRGVGDAALNYRYQLAGMNGGRLAIAPRVSVILATGNSALGTGAGGASFQANLPVSVEAAPQLTLHANAGMTHTVHAQNALGDRAAATSVAGGGSAVWLATASFNVLVESVWSRTATVSAPGVSTGANQWVVAPGVRWAHNLARGMQVVPGIAYVVGVGPSVGTNALFAYLSVEHPFAR